MKPFYRSLFVLGIALILVGSSFSAHHEKDHKDSLFQKVFQKNYSRTCDKIVDLAKAIPEDKYEWSPAEGIRSVRESILHVTSANYFIASRLGSKPPEGVNPREMESTIQGKEATIEALEKSIQFVKEVTGNVSEDDLATELDFFRGKAPKMAAIVVLGDHASEHLGQLIAYARSIDVVPPWSQ